MSYGTLFTVKIIIKDAKITIKILNVHKIWEINKCANIICLF